MRITENIAMPSFKLRVFLTSTKFRSACKNKIIPLLFRDSTEGKRPEIQEDCYPHKQKNQFSITD